MKKQRSNKKDKKSIQKLAKRKKDKIKEYQRKIYQQLIQYKKEALQKRWALLLLSIKMSEKTLKFDNIKVNKNEFHKSKQPINIDLINVYQIVVSDKFKPSDDSSKYFVGYKEGEIVILLFIILPQMSGYIKYFENGDKNMYFMVKNDDGVLDVYNEIWNKIKKRLSIKFHSMPVYDEK